MLLLAAVGGWSTAETNPAAAEKDKAAATQHFQRAWFYRAGDQARRAR